MEFARDAYKAGQSGAQLLRSIAGSLTCQWFPESCVIRYPLGQGGFVKDYKTLFKSRGNTTIDAMKLVVRFMGAPYDSQATDTNGKQRSYVAFAIIVKKAEDSIPDITMDTYQQLPEYENALMVKDKNAVIFGTFVALNGWEDSQLFEVGFKNGSYPGNKHLGPGDEIGMLTLGTFNLESPGSTLSGKKGDVVGTLTLKQAEGVPDTRPSLA